MKNWPAWSGLPPRVRGKAEVRHERDQEPGITPACAGKRSAWPPVLRRQRDHPRVCGEKLPLNVIPNSIKGSPPRMRGKAFRPAVIARWHRITPACAGKSCPLPRRTVSVRDHPRVCGEKRPDWKNEVELVGSPPRVRGKGEQTARPHYHMRITPACAGKRAGSSGNSSTAGDHPRVCGEKKNVPLRMST